MTSNPDLYKFCNGLLLRNYHHYHLTTTGNYHHVTLSISIFFKKVVIFMLFMIHHVTHAWGVYRGKNYHRRFS